MQACEWPVDYAECGPCDSLSSMPASGVERYETMATEFLWRWTGRRYGLCQGTIRPCRQDSHSGTGPVSGGSPWTPALVGGRWVNLGCYGGNCGGTAGATLRFDVPAAEIVSVEVDGAVLPSGSYRLDNHTLLVRQDGDLWPYRQDMDRPLGEPGTWGVTVKVGEAVPIGGQMAAGKLACELAKAACGAEKCELPKRVQSLSRQGVSIQMMLDTFDDLDKGRTGIWLIDSWVASVTRPDEVGFAVASPDVRPARRTTWPR